MGMSSRVFACFSHAMPACIRALDVTFSASVMSGIFEEGGFEKVLFRNKPVYDREKALVCH